MSAPRDPREDALARLPAGYALALRLRNAEVADEMIAARLGIELEALGPLLALAEAKLAALRHRAPPSEAT
ncbi:hypothetical protein ACWCXB_07785 [Streptomyces sp. NPDC001514]